MKLIHLSEHGPLKSEIMEVYNPGTSLTVFMIFHKYDPHYSLLNVYYHPTINSPVLSTTLDRLL